MKAAILATPGPIASRPLRITDIAQPQLAPHFRAVVDKVRRALPPKG